MSQDIERYLQAGTRANTRRSYQQALEHFEVSWGCLLYTSSWVWYSAAVIIAA